MEKIDYPEFVKNFVKERISGMNVQASEEKILYIAQDLEDWMLDAGRSVKDVTAVERHHIEDFIRERL